MLAHFNPSLETCLQIDVSEYALGPVLCHLVQQDGKLVEKPVCYASNTLDRTQANYSETEKECLARVWSTDLFHTVLLGHQFVLQMDHSASKQLLTTKTATCCLAQWAMKLQGFNMTVFHRKGKTKVMLIFCYDWFTVWMANSLWIGFRRGT